MTPEQIQQMEKIRKDLQDLTDEYYRYNFSAQQDFYKKCDFKTRVKVPHYSSTPTTAETGELCEVGGKLYVASATNTWVVSGTQS